MDDLGPLHHYMGIELNQQTWALLGKKERNDRDNQRMIAFAKSSLFHWEHSPNFQPVNAKLFLWLISRVYSVLGYGEKALYHANEFCTLTE